jgi:hypothetical protein
MVLSNGACCAVRSTGLTGMSYDSATAQGCQISVYQHFLPEDETAPFPPQHEFDCSEFIRLFSARLCTKVIKEEKVE